VTRAGKSKVVGLDELFHGTRRNPSMEDSEESDHGEDDESAVVGEDLPPAKALLRKQGVDIQSRRKKRSPRNPGNPTAKDIQESLKTTRV
jgi:hypothetical protein